MQRSFETTYERSVTQNGLTPTMSATPLRTLRATGTRCPGLRYPRGQMKHSCEQGRRLNAFHCVSQPRPRVLRPCRPSTRVFSRRSRMSSAEDGQSALRKRESSLDPALHQINTERPLECAQNVLRYCGHRRVTTDLRLGKCSLLHAGCHHS
jgi:hypothetical protein